MVPIKCRVMMMNIWNVILDQDQRLQEYFHFGPDRAPIQTSRRLDTILGGGRTPHPSSVPSQTLLAFGLLRMFNLRWSLPTQPTLQSNVKGIACKYTLHIRPSIPDQMAK